MHNPFPGMNPYLETTLWNQVHNRLIVAIADALNAQITPKYRASIEERIYTSVVDRTGVGISDVAVSRGAEAELELRQPVQTLTQPASVLLPMPEEVTERFLEIRLVADQRLVTVIEILSNKNKSDPRGRAVYEQKRQQILGSQTNLVEIDLLRVGEPMLLMEMPSSRYRILLSRSWRRPQADLYYFGLPDPIPSIPIPLLRQDEEPVIALQQLLDEIYTRARFDLAIDYTQPVSPKLSPHEAAWVQERLQQIG